MNQRNLLVWSLPLILIAGLVGWWTLGRRSNEVHEDAHLAAVASPDEAQPAAPEAPDEGLAAPAAERADVAVTDTEGELRAAVLARSIAVPLRITLPAGVPTDELLEPVAISFPASAYGSADKAREAAREWSPASNDAERMFASFLGTATDRNDKSVTLPCEPDGRGGWIARFAEDSPAGVVELRARYCYVTEPMRVGAPAAEREIVLEPKLGAWLTGRVVLPAQLPADHDPAALAEIDVRLVGWSMGGNSHAPSTRLAADQSFSIGGLRPGLNYFLSLDALSFVPVMDAEVKVRAGERVDKVYDLALGARVRGIVRLPDGSPAKGAAVRASGGGRGMDWIRGAMGREATTDAEGRFDLRGITPGKRDLSALLDGYVDGLREDLELADGQLLEDVELALGAGNTVSGIVLWPDRTPVKGASVRIRGVEDESPERAVRNARRGGMRGAMRAVSGGSESVLTGDDGRFTRSGIEASRVSVTATASRPLSGFEAQWIASAGPSPATQAFELVLVEPLPIRGRVLDAAGLPQASFRISIANAEGNQGPREGFGDFAGLFGGGGESTSFTDREDGSFIVHVQPGSYDLRAEAEGYTRSEAQRAQAPGDAVLEFRLARAGQVSGVVLDPAGVPVSGAKVTATRDSGRGMFGRMGGKNATADEQGRFTIPELTPGNCVLSATSEGWAPSEDVEVMLEPGRDLADVRITLRVGGRLEGVIYKSTGEPDPDRQIMIGNFGPGGGDMGGNTQSDASGRFVAEHIAPGKYNVMALPNMNTLANSVGGEDDEFDVAGMMSQLKMTPVEIFDAQTTTVVLGAPPASPVRVTGRVTQGDQPKSRGMVMAFADGSSMLSSMKAARIAADGTYTLTLDAPGDYSFIVGEQMGDSDGTEFQETIPALPEHVLDLEVPSGVLRGRVVGADGSPAGGVGLSAEREGRASIFSFDMGRNNQTASDGTFELTNLRPGRYTLRVGNTGMAAMFGQRPRFGTAVVAGIDLADGQVREGLVIELATPCTIEGVVRTGEGKPASGATVFVRDSSGRVLNPMSGCMSDADGAFKFEGAAPGAYTVSARRETESSRESAPVQAQPGQPAKVELLLETGTMLKVSVEDKDGKLVRASVRVVDGDGREYTNMLSAESFQSMFTEGFSSTEQRIGPLPPGKYRVTATDETGKSESKPLTVSGQAERAMRIRLD